ncbi:hypothetical protein JOM56_002879 [Amanita muscaria]
MPFGTSAIPIFRKSQNICGIYGQRREDHTQPVDKGKALESASHNNTTAVTAPAAAPADATALSSTSTAVASTPAHYKAVVDLLATTLPAGPEELATALMACDSTILKGLQKDELSYLVMEHKLGSFAKAQSKEKFINTILTVLRSSPSEALKQDIYKLLKASKQRPKKGTRKAVKG